MKTTVFALENGEIIRDASEGPFEKSRCQYEVPTLPAYAILSTSLEYPDSKYFETAGLQPNYAICGNQVLVYDQTELDQHSSGLRRLIVHYAGISRYEDLFPSVASDSTRQQKLARFAEEADISFENGAWMSFLVMAAGVLEGLLGHHTGARKLYYGIERALAAGLLDSTEAEICHEIRTARNELHPYLTKSDLPTRSLAMRAYVLYNTLLKRHWPPPSNVENY